MNELVNSKSNNLTTERLEALTLTEIEKYGADV
jgi:hypothetical protein